MPDSFQREADMTAFAIAAARKWWGGGREPHFVADEIVGPDAVADLVAARFDHDRLQRRFTAGIYPVTDVLALRVLLTARRRSFGSAELADTCRVSQSGIRRAIRIALDSNALLQEGRARYRTHPSWGPGTSRLVAVELKLSDWPSALHQAEAYARWANTSWVLLARIPPEGAIEYAAHAGIGLGFLSSTGIIRVRSRPTTRRRSSNPLAALWAGEQVIERALSTGSISTPK